MLFVLLIFALVCATFSVGAALESIRLRKIIANFLDENPDASIVRCPDCGALHLDKVGLRRVTHCKLCGFCDHSVHVDGHCMTCGADTGGAST